MKTIVSATTLPQLGDGYVGKIIDEGIAQIFKDLDERGQDGKDRSLPMNLTFTPLPNGRVEIKFSAKPNLPKFVPPKTVARLELSAGGLMFNPDLAENPDQKTFTEEIDEREGNREAKRKANKTREVDPARAAEGEAA